MENSTINQEAPKTEQYLNNQETFFLKYKKAIIAAVVAVIVIIAGSIAFSTFYWGPRADKASTALANAQELFANEQFEKALNGDKGSEGFLAVASNYSGTDAANLANLYAGLCYQYHHLHLFRQLVFSRARTRRMRLLKSIRLSRRSTLTLLLLWI